MSPADLGRRAALIKLGFGDMALGSKPAAPAPAAPKPPAAAPPAPTPRPPAPRPAAGGLGQQVAGFFRNPANMAQVIGASGDLGRSVLGATGAPGLFAMSNLARGGGEMASILRGGIPSGG